MPSLQEVEQFKNILNELGDEPEILAERDEEIEDVTPPEQGLPDGLSELLETPEGAPAEAGIEGPAGEQPVPFPAAPPEETVDLSDLLGEEDLSGLDILEGVELPAGEPEGPEAPTEEAAVPAEAPLEVETPAEAVAPAEAEILEGLEGLLGPEAPAEEAAAPQTPETEEISLEDLGLELPEGPEGPQALVEAAVEPEPAAPEAPEVLEPEGAEVSMEEALGDLFPTEPPEVSEEAAEPAEDEFTVPPGLLEPEAAAEEEPFPESPEIPADFEIPETPTAPETEEAFEIPEDFAFPTEEEGVEAEAAPEEVVLEDVPGFELPVEEMAEPGVEMPEETPEFELPAEEALELGAEAPAEIPEFELPTEEAAEPAAEIPMEAAEFELPGEEVIPPAAEVPVEAAEFELPEEAVAAEELPEMPGFDIEGFDADAFAMPEEEETEGAAEPFPEPFDEAAAEEGAVAPEIEVPGEAGFEMPEEFQLPEEEAGEEVAAEEPFPEMAPPEEAAAEPSEEEAAFLQVLQDQILPDQEAAAEQPAGAEAEASLEVPLEEPGEAPAGEISLDQFAEIPLEAEALPEAEISLEEEVAGAPPETPLEETGEAPAAEEIPAEIPVGEEVAFPEGEQIDLEAPAEIDVPGAEDFDLDEFSLEGLGEAFAVEEQAEVPPAPEEEIPAEVPIVEEQIPEEIVVPGEGDITFTDKQFAAIKRTLSLLPRNLKIAIEELIAEKGLEGEELRSLLALLIEGAAAGAIAEQVSSLTGQRIVLPKVFERLTGMAFVERRRTFGYAFRENIFPILRVVLLSLIFLGLLSFLGYRYVYKPVYANYLYRQGYTQIEKERYRMANDSFDRATSVWAFKNWFFRYAQGFTERKQYQLAAEKYEQLLRRFPGDRKGKLSYASLLTFHFAGYEKADKLLGEVLAVDMKDYDALLARGDNYLEWAQEDDSRYAEARFAYASIIDYYGERDEVLVRMLRYFIRTEKFDETRTLKAYLDDKGNLRVDPEIYASTYAELAGFWIDKGHYDSVPDMLFKAMDQKMNEPGIHYQLARYYRYVQDQREEETALKAAIELLEQMQPLDKKHLFMMIDSYNRRGETFWRREEYLTAEEYFQKAITRIEDAQDRRIFGNREEFGLVYKNYGDIYYYISRDLEPALDLYLNALNNRYETPGLNYKIGYIHYAADRYEDSLLSFSKVVDQRPTNENALYALANSLYSRGYYSSAQGYYLRLINLLEGREERIPYLQIYDNPEHSALVEYIMKVYNNLGVTLKQLADRSRDPEKESKALVNMTFSSERFDLLSRDPVTVERGLTKNLAYLNQGGILYPTSDFQLQIYTRLPIDLQANRF